MIRYYEVDEAMIGQEWRGSQDDLRSFVELLNEELDGTDIVAVAHTSSGNGAQNPTDLSRETDAPFQRATERTPIEWWSDSCVCDEVVMHARETARFQFDVELDDLYDLDEAEHREMFRRQLDVDGWLSSIDPTEEQLTDLVASIGRECDTDELARWETAWRYELALLFRERS